MRGGVNGEIVEPEDAESSALYLSVEDGTMPEDDDRLTDEEVAIIKKWIDLGAELDAGVRPDEALASIIPRVPQPQPPETYRVAVPVTAVAFSPDGQLLATAGYHEVILWSAKDGRLVRRLSDVAQQTCGIDFSPEGETVVVASGTPAEVGETSLFRVSDGQRLRTLIRSTGVMYSARYSRNGQWVATAGEDKLVYVFNANDGSRRFRLADHFGTVTDVAWAPEDRWLASVSLDRNVKVFDTKTGLQVANFQKASESNFEGMAYGVDFSPDGSKVVSCGNHRHVRVSRTDDGELVREIGGFDASVMRVRVSQTGTVYSSSANHRMTAHNLEDGSLVRSFEGHRDWVYALAVHEATGRLASGSHDGEVRIWNAATGELLLSFIGSPGQDAR
jgi:WD40 repeat protein